MINDTESKPEDGDLGHENVDDLPDSEETTADDPVTSLGSDAGKKWMMKVITTHPRMIALRTGRSSSDDSEAVEDGEGEGKADKDGGKEKDEGIVTPRMKAMPALPHTLTICLLMMLSRH